MQAAAQPHIDSAISKTINCPAGIAFADFQSIYLDAHRMGLKGCTTYRPNTTTGSVLSTEPAPPAPALHAHAAASPTGFAESRPIETPMQSPAQTQAQAPMQAYETPTQCPNCSEIAYVGHGGCGSCRTCGHSQCE